MRHQWLGGAMLVLLASGLSEQVMAQTYPDCPPPTNEEYLLLVRSTDEAMRDRTISVLPTDKPTLVCNYLGDTVVRAGGFDSLEVANSWALYLNDIEQLETVVVEPSAPEETAVAVAEGSQPQRYNPTLLGEGVAVLVDYQQDPSIGKKLLVEDGNVGLAVYLQEPYLLVLHTTDSSQAASRLQQLIDGGLTSFLVDGQRVIRLTETIAQ